MHDDKPANGAAAEQLFAQAVQLNNVGRHAECVRACQRILALQADHAGALNLLGIHAHRGGDTARAIEHLEAAHRAAPDDAGVLSNLGLVLEGSGRVAEAIAANRSALARDAARFSAWFNLGNCHRSLGEFAAAVDAYRKALALRPGEFAVLCNLAASLAGNAERDAAIEAYREALTAQPDDGQALSNLGNVLLDVGELDEAVATLRRAAEVAPGFVDAHCNLAIALLRSDDVPGARAACDAALALDPVDRSALAILAIAAGRGGDLAVEGELLDLDRIVMTDEIEVPAGFADGGAFNAALAEHVCAHPTLTYEPPTKSTRGGQQSQNLLVGEPGPIAGLRQAIERAVARYLERTRDLAGRAYPSGLPARWRLNIWATILDAQGHQLPHIHPAGWLSGVYYATVPASIGAGDEAGWIEFGRPPAELGGEHTPPLRTLQPREGLLALFPSYLYHRTLPFAGAERRISIAFDVLPDADYSPEQVRRRDAALEQAKSLLAAGRQAEAVALCERLVAADPQAAQAHLLLGRLRERNADYPAALKHFRAAGADAASAAAARRSASGLLRRLGRAGEARALWVGEAAGTELEQVLALQAAGEAAGAAQQLAALLRRQPALAPAHYLASRDAGFPVDAGYVERLRAARAAQPAPARTTLGFALGHALARRQEFAAAAAAFVEANSERLANLAKRGPDPADDTPGLIEAFEPGLFADSTAGVADRQGLAFLTGFPGTGCGFAATLLAALNGVQVLETGGLLLRAVAQLAAGLPAGRRLPQAVGDIGAAHVRTCADAYREAVATLAPGATIVVDWLPHNHTLLGMIRLLFPDAAILNCRRGREDALLAAYQTALVSGRRWSSEPAALQTAWRRFTTLDEHWRRTLPGRWIDLAMDEFGANPAAAVRTLAARLELPPIATAAPAAPASPSLRNGAWRDFRPHLAELFTAPDAAGDQDND